jgi:hypothetical protein
MNSQKELEGLQWALSNLIGERFDEVEFWNEKHPELFDETKAEFNKAYVKLNRPKPYEDFEDYNYYFPNLYLVFGTDTLGKFDRYYHLGILCTWHLLKNAKSLCSYVGSYDRDGLMMTKLGLILNQTVKQAILIPEQLNVFLEFENHLWLAIFPKFLGIHIGTRNGRPSGTGGHRACIHNMQIYSEIWA